LTINISTSIISQIFGGNFILLSRGKINIISVGPCSHPLCNSFVFCYRIYMKNTLVFISKLVLITWVIQIKRKLVFKCREREKQTHIQNDRQTEIDTHREN